MAGLLQIGQNYKRSALNAGKRAADLEEYRSQANEQLKMAEDAQQKNAIGTGMGLGYAYAPEIASAVGLTGAAGGGAAALEAVGGTAAAAGGAMAPAAGLAAAEAAGAGAAIPGLAVLGPIGLAGLAAWGLSRLF